MNNFFWCHSYLGQIAEDIGNNLHRRFWRKDVRIADHELFENVVLNCSSQFSLLCTLTTQLTNSNATATCRKLSAHIIPVENVSWPVTLRYKKWTWLFVTTGHKHSLEFDLDLLPGNTWQIIYFTVYRTISTFFMTFTAKIQYYIVDLV